MYYTTEHILIIISDEQRLCTKYILDNNIHKLLLNYCYWALLVASMTFQTYLEKPSTVLY